MSVAVARALYERFKELIHEFAKFGVIGVIGLFITNGGYDLLHDELGVGPVTSTTVATIVATVVAFVGNRQWTFRDRERTGVVRESVLFFILNGIGLLIQDAAVGFSYYIVGLHDHASGFIALNTGIVIATLFRFWSYRTLVWSATPAAKPWRTLGVLTPRAPGSHARAAVTGTGVPGANGHDRVPGTTGHTVPGPVADPGPTKVG